MECVADKEHEKPHAVCLPFPAQGHINPMFKLAILLHQKGFHITFVNSDYNHKRLLKSRGSDALSALPGFVFETIPDGLPPVDDSDVTQPIASLACSTQKNWLAPFRRLLAKLYDDSASSSSSPPVSSPPVTCVISDGIMSFSAEAAKEIGVPCVFFRTTAACAFMCNLHYRHLIDKGLIPLKDESYLSNGYLESGIEWVPGMRNIRLRDFPATIRTTDVSNNDLIRFVIEEAEAASKATATILNTLDDLEPQVLHALSSMCPQLHTLGPLNLLVKNLIPHADLASNLWKEETECLQWLNSKEPNSVVYVSFGSITVMTSQQLMEFAWGLANSRANFLWIIRPDQVVGDSLHQAAATLPAGFVEETRERGLISGWCPQEKVLNHPSIGVFITHCGWNSMMESLSNGVPMLCWPFFADQPTNCRYAVVEWGVGEEIDKDVRREALEEMVREMMQGEKGRRMKRKAMEWKKKAETAAGFNGSSYLNLNRLANQVCC